MNGRRVLTVDDSPTMRDMLAHTLGSAGYHVIQAKDGKEGVAILAKETFDCVITDVNMPNLDGLDMIEEVRRDERHRATPILVLTTESAPELKDRARKAGATGWIVKPFDPVKLMDVMRKVGA